MTGACWSTAICTESERHALGLAPDGEWLLTCRLSDGHTGDHATDASMRPRNDRRTWLTWNDRAIHRLLDQPPCAMRSRSGVQCLLFAAHGGMHYYGVPNQAGPRSATAESIDLADVRISSGRAADSGRPVSSRQAETTALTTLGAAPFDVGVSTGPSHGTETPPRVTETPPRVTETLSRVVQAPSHATAAEPATAAAPNGDPVAEALVVLASAIEELAEAIRRRSS